MRWPGPTHPPSSVPVIAQPSALSETPRSALGAQTDPGNSLLSGVVSASGVDKNAPEPLCSARCEPGCQYLVGTGVEATPIGGRPAGATGVRRKAAQTDTLDPSCSGETDGAFPRASYPAVAASPLYFLALGRGGRVRPYAAIAWSRPSRARCRSASGTVIHRPCT